MLPRLHSAYPSVPAIVNRIAGGDADGLPAAWWDTMGQALTLLAETRSPVCPVALLRDEWQ